MSELNCIFPEVLSEHHDNETLVMKLRIPHELDYFKGHFPSTPILPGVVQLHWAVAYAKQKLLPFSFDIENVEVLKFQVVIVPGQELQLTLSKKSENKFLFSYHSDLGQHASGRLVLSQKS